MFNNDGAFIYSPIVPVQFEKMRKVDSSVVNQEIKRLVHILNASVFIVSSVQILKPLMQ